MEEIAHLNLLEVADLNALLKSRLNISDAPVMVAGGGAVASAPKEEVFIKIPLKKKILDIFEGIESIYFFLIIEDLYHFFCWVISLVPELFFPTLVLFDRVYSVPRWLGS